MADHAIVDVGVVIPAYCCSMTIERALGSIRGQKVLPRHIVIVDDGSPDDSAAKAEAWRHRLLPVKLTIIRQQNAGAGAARNRGLIELDTEWVAFLDADDEWTPNKLHICMDTLKRHNLDMISTNMIVVEEGGNKVEFDCAKWFLEYRADLFSGLFLRGWIATSTVVIRRSKIMEAGGFDPSLRSAQDYELWLAILADRNCRLEVIPDSLTIYHRTDGSITTLVERRRRASMAVLRRHAGSLRCSYWNIRRLILLRTLIIHYEAFTGHLRTRDWGKLAMTTLTCLYNAVVQPFFPRRHHKRPSFFLLR